MGAAFGAPAQLAALNSVTVRAYVVLPRYGTLTVLGVGELQHKSVVIAVPVASVTTKRHDTASPCASAGETLTSMLRMVGGAPTVIGTGCPSSPVIVALTAAFALAGANKPATTTAATSILPLPSRAASCWNSV